MTLAPIDKNAVSVVSMLEKAKVWLDTAVSLTGPEEIAAAKAQIRTAEVYAKELHLSKGIQDDAAEMVRRAEYALGKSIRKGQDEGTIATRGQMQRHAGHVSAAQRLGQTKPLAELPKPSDFASESELMGARSDGILALTDGVTPEQFEQAVANAREEGNLSRANVVRKVKGENADVPATRQQRADLIEDLAGQGYTSHQMADRVGVRADRVRSIARDFDIDIHADRVVGRGNQRIDHTAAVESAVTSLDNWASSLTFIDFAEVDDDAAEEWVASLKESRTRLNAFISAIEKRTARAATRAVQTAQ